MGPTHASNQDHHEPGLYEIRVKGYLDSRWADWFDGLSLTHENEGTTTLYGQVVDQAALHGLLRKVRDLGLPLISVTHAPTGQAGGSDIKQPIEASTLERNQDGVN